MQRQRLVFGLLLLLLVAMSGMWLWRRLTAPVPAHPVSATPARTGPTATALPSETPLQAPPGYRLAGVALGEPDSFAVIEAPNGSHVLYHLDADVPGLGRLIRIESERVVIETAAGRFDLWLTPAATVKPTRDRTAAVRTPMARLTPRPARGGTASGSRSSAVPDRPVS
jgi:hypothetical protein